MAARQDPRIGKAFRAMKELGISGDVVKPVLKNLLRVYDKNWKYIEDENYRVLVDAIFGYEDEKVTAEKKRPNVDDVQHELEQPLKRLQSSHENQDFPSIEGSRATSIQDANLNSDIALADIYLQPLQVVMEPPKPPECNTNLMEESEPDSPPTTLRLRDRRLTASKALAIVEASETPQAPKTNEALHFSQMGQQDQNVSPKYPSDEERTYTERPPQLLCSMNPGMELSIKPDMVGDTSTFIKPKTEPEVSERATDELAVTVSVTETTNEMFGTETTSFVEDIGINSFLDTDAEISKRGEQTGAQSVSTEIDSEDGFVRVCNSANDAVNKVIQSQSDTLPAFCNSVNCITNALPLLPEDIAISARTNGFDTSARQDLGGTDRLCDSANDAVNKVIQSESEALSSFCNSDNGITNALPLLPEDIAISGHTNGLDTSVHQAIGWTDNIFEIIKEKEVLEEGAEKSVSVSVDKQNQTGTKNSTYMLDASDITKGEEKIKISIVNHFNDVPLPSFCYIQQSVGGQNAVVNISLAQIGKEDCCPNCVGDCLSLKETCICACTAGESCVYASNGILKDEFLEESISMNRNPQKHRLFFCEDCPLDAGKDKDAGIPCQGHLVRKVVKECWLKCYCSKKCTNRRVQRGISYKLQVFMTSSGKGWGLRTLEDLPKGAFVCEFVGEILTLCELFLQYQSSLKNCAYAIVLDAGWASSKELKEDKDKALCLDASVYGNVARFINHRCTDANLVGVPVKVETSDNLYHRVAFFTSRKVAALEELTRDYGISFDDFEGLTKPFRCRCGSSFCRNMKRYNRKKSKRKYSKAFEFK